MSLQLAIGLVGGAIVLLVMALVVVRIARGLDGTSAARAAAAKAKEKASEKPRMARMGEIVARLQAARRGDAAAATELKDMVKRDPGGSFKRGTQGLAAFAAVATIVGGIATAIGKETRSPPVSSEITAGALHGTLLTGKKPKKVVLIIPGSGPTDRDGDSPLGVKAAPYRLLAEGLADEGIASVRVDKRGAFASAAAGDGNAVTKDLYVADYRAWIDTVRKATGKRCIWLLGHSEGAIWATAAAEGRKDVCGLILVSAPGRNMGDILRAQLAANPGNAPIMGQIDASVAALKAGRHVDLSTIHPALAQVFPAQVQDFLISEFAIDPVDLLRKAKKKTLIVQGANDLQITEEDADLLNKAPRTTLRIISGMNHVLKLAPADRAGNIATYSDPNLPLAPKLVDRIADFVKDDD